MRLDKYLKVSRLVKRRTVANDLCKGGHVKINGQSVKASSEVSEGDQMQIRFGSRLKTVKVLIVPSKAVSVQEAPSLYEMLGEEILERDL